MLSRLRFALFLLLLGALPAMGESKHYGPYEVIYTVVNSTFIEPEVAARYQLVRAKDRAFINIAIREQLEDGSNRAVTARIEGRSWDLLHNQFLEFKEVREGDAVYYLADFQFSDGELRFFNLQFLPEGETRSSQLKFQHKVYVEQ